MRPIKWSPVSWAIILGLKMVLSAGFMHGPSPLGLWSSMGPVRPPRRAQMWLNQTKPNRRFGHMPGGPLSRPWRYTPVFDKDRGRPCPSRCVSKLASLDLAVDKGRCHGRQDLIHERCVALIALRLSAAHPTPILRPGSCNAKPWVQVLGQEHVVGQGAYFKSRGYRR